VWSGMKGIGLGTGLMGIECWRFRTHVFDIETAVVALRRGRLRIILAVLGNCEHRWTDGGWGLYTYRSSVY
jgi:hypothetical protein